MNDIEIHPFEPWLPKDARLLMLGTFPPAPKRWCMDWYYPNFQNDMWRIMGICFYILLTLLFGNNKCVMVTLTGCKDSAF